MLERIMIFCINIFCPPLSVMLIAGPGTDCLINLLLFIAGVIPAHVHGFYISCTYFHRKRKVRKGIYPGGRKPLIYSEKVWNGGASNKRVRELLDAQRAGEEGMGMKRSKSSRTGGGGSQRRSRQMTERM